MIASYSQRLNYGTCNEDSCSELRAVGPLTGKTIVCVTGSGGRTLNLLTDRPARIVSVDVNPLQSALLELKLAAIRTLSYRDYRRFLGLDIYADRVTLYRAVARRLGRSTRVIWDGRMGDIRRGVLYAGRFEKHYAQTARVLKLFKGRTIDALFECRDLAQQHQLYWRQWNDNVWRALLRLDGLRANYRYSLRDPAYYYDLPADFDYANFFADSMERMLLGGLAYDNHFLALTLDGSYRRARLLPLCLREEHYATLQECADRVEIVTSGLDSYLASQGSDWADGFSLSDVSSYLLRSEFESLLTEVLRSARHGAMICARNYMRTRNIPASLADRMRRRTGIEEELRRKDLSAVYEFVVAQVDKTGG